MNKASLFPKYWFEVICEIPDAEIEHIWALSVKRKSQARVPLLPKSDPGAV